MKISERKLKQLRIARITTLEVDHKNLSDIKTAFKNKKECEHVTRGYVFCRAVQKDETVFGIILMGSRDAIHEIEGLIEVLKKDEKK